MNKISIYGANDEFMAPLEFPIFLPQYDSHPIVSMKLINDLLYNTLWQWLHDFLSGQEEIYFIKQAINLLGQQWKPGCCYASSAFNYPLYWNRAMNKFGF